MSIAYKSSKLQGLVDLSASAHVEEMEMAALKKSVTSKFRNDYCGLPPYSIHLNPLAIAYKSRAPAVQVSDPEIEEHTMVSSRQTIVKVDNSNSTVKKNNVGNINKSNIEIEDNNIAQKKVALALLTMVKNEHLVEHFMGKGGLDAVLKLIGETRDIEVQLTCAYCLIEASYIIENCLPLLKSNVFGAIQTFIESNNDDVRNAASQILANLTTAPGLENLLIQSNIVTFLQIINNQLHRVDTMCFLLLALCNIANAISLPEMAEIVMRICTIISQKLDVMKSLPKAKFISDMYCNYSRLHNYSSRLVEEGVMPLLLLMMDTHPNDNVIDRCSEVLANLSLNRKYRREISSSGIGSRLTALFNKGSPSARSSILLLTGNLLSSNLFHDKVANQVTLANILNNLFDLNHPAQFNTVAYCLCQLSRVETSCQVVVECGAVPMILNYLTRSPPPESLDYLWTVLTDITSFNDFIEPILAKSSRDLVLVLYEESINKASKPNQLHCVVQISFNISRRPDLSSFLSFDLIESLVKALKNMFALTSSSSSSSTSNRSSNDNEYIQMTSLSTLININHHCREARACTLAGDLIDLFEKNGLDNGRLNVKYIGLLNIVSNEENCCYHMLEMHVQKLIVSLQESFIRLVSTVPGGQKQKSRGKKKKTSRDDDDDEREYNAEVEGELGKELSAATLNNLAMKRPNGAPGVLSTLLTLAKNCKTMRVLYCIRSLAHMSVHMKAKVMLSKEARKIIPMLTVVMRCGCEEAERVQHYCSITLCNMLTTPIEKGLLLEFSKSGAIVDLVVVTMLRINATDTKEVLGKVFFNLLNRPEIREILVVKLDLLSSILELTKVEHIGLLEICIHAIYNVTCELIPTSGVEDQFAEKLKALKMPRFMINKLNYNPEADGSVGNRFTRNLIGKALCNMSFNKSLAIEITNEAGAKIADAMYRIYVLGSEENIFCACSILYNISTIAECRVLTESKAIKLTIDVINSPSSNVLSIKLCIATLCNFSLMNVFFDSLMATEVINTFVFVLSSPQMHSSMKKDVIQTVYNLVTRCTASRAVFVSCDVVVSLWKYLKAQSGGVLGMAATDGSIESGSISGGGRGGSNGGGSNGDGGDDEAEQDEYVLILIAHVVRELCEELERVLGSGSSSGNSIIIYERKLISDGIMNIILKLSKFELALIKLDMSFCIYSLSKGHEVMKLIKSDAVDIIFWLTLHDTLGMQDTIFANVSRALRCISGRKDEAKALLRQERFLVVFRALIKSKNEDVLWQTAGCMYNLMCVEHCLKLLLDRGLVEFIFEIAASGFESVKHICSSCLHMIPDHMPSMDDPVVLELVLCLLEAQGDKFSQLTEKPADVLPYTMVQVCHKSSIFKLERSDFKATWTPQNSEIDNFFTPVLLQKPIHEAFDTGPTTYLDAYSVPSVLVHTKMNVKHYSYFRTESRPPTAPVDNNFSTLNATQQQQQQRGSIGLSAPVLPARVPPGYNNNNVTHVDDVDSASSHNNDDDSQSLSTKASTSAPSEYNYNLVALGVSSFASKSNNRTSTPNRLTLSKVTSSKQYVEPVSKKLPLISQQPKLPDDTVGALNRTINNDSRIMSRSTSAIPTGPGLNGSTQPVSSAKANRRPAERVVQISVNEHGNYSR